MDTDSAETVLDDQSGDRPLAEAIQIATRSVHARLNKLIIDRLPLALPPAAADPSPYLSGILHITPIYAAFEACWNQIVDTLPDQGPEITGSRTQASLEELQEIRYSSPVHHVKVDKRIRAMLQSLRLPGLMRTQRLRADVQSLTGWSEQMVDGQVQMTGQTGRLGDFISHIKRVTERKPHVLLAYSYILYMALFSGGRFIRAALESAGDDFWARTASPLQPISHSCQTREQQHQDEPREPYGEASVPKPSSIYPHANHDTPLSFFHFQTPFDGEDLKQDFKKRLRVSENLLTLKERQDIIQESLCIFENMTFLVQQLDHVCLLSEDSEPQDQSMMNHLAHLLKHPLGNRPRDSVAVTHERRAKSSPRRSSEKGSESGTYSYRRERRSQTSDQLHSLPGGHFPVGMAPGLDNIKLCPAATKSMRFEQALPQPGLFLAHSKAQPSQDPEEKDLKLTAFLQLKSNETWVIYVAGLLALTFGVVLLGALVPGGIQVVLYRE